MVWDYAFNLSKNGGVNFDGLRPLIRRAAPISRWAAPIADISRPFRALGYSAGQVARTAGQVAGAAIFQKHLHVCVVI